eukprot:g46323.t1
MPLWMWSEWKEAFEIGGYDEEWMDSEEILEYVCPICTFVARDAVAHECGQIFCQDCFEQWASQGECCSTCRQSGVAAPAHRDRRAIRNLEVSCSNHCGETHRLGAKEEHLTSQCSQRPIRCPFRCSKVAPAVDMDVHLKSECPHRTVVCPDCGEDCTPAMLPTHHASLCSERLVHCPLCKEEVPHCKLASHIAQNVGSHLLELAAQNARLVDQVQFLTSENTELRGQLDKLAATPRRPRTTPPSAPLVPHNPPPSSGGGGGTSNRRFAPQLSPAFLPVRMPPLPTGPQITGHFGNVSGIDLGDRWTCSFCNVGGQPLETQSCHVCSLARGTTIDSRYALPSRQAAEAVGAFNGIGHFNLKED